MRLCTIDTVTDTLCNITVKEVNHDKDLGPLDTSVF